MAERIVWEVMPPDWTPPQTCGVRRGPRAKTHCELPPDHKGGHFGRSPSGRWFWWDAAAAGEGGA